MAVVNGILGGGLEPEQVIYRTVPFARLEQMLVKKQNVLVRPRKWSDTFEDLLGKSDLLMAGSLKARFRTDNIYGQCWTLHTASDAIWQIYSKENPITREKDGFRIRTTVGRLISSIKEKVKDGDFRCYIGRVRYLSECGLRDFGRTHFTNPKAIPSEVIASAYLVKRRAFKHEREARLIYQAPEHAENVDLFPYLIDPNSLIDQIMIHPAISPEKSKEIKAVLRGMGFSGEIKRSLLYKEPKGFAFRFGPTD